jgi:hypothetical protein
MFMPVQPSQKEEEYFARVELERRKKVELERMRTLAETEKQRLRELHHMHCPKCGMDLKEVDYKGIKVDRCFTCDGVWLDAGELDAIAALDTPALNKLFNVFKK